MNTIVHSTDAATRAFGFEGLLPGVHTRVSSAKRCRTAGWRHPALLSTADARNNPCPDRVRLHIQQKREA